MKWKNLLTQPLFFGVVLAPSEPLLMDGCPPSVKEWNKVIGPRVDELAKSINSNTFGNQVGGLIDTFLDDTSKAARVCKDSPRWGWADEGECVENILEFKNINTLLSKGGTSTFGVNQTEVPKGLTDKSFLSAIAKNDLKKASKYLATSIARGVMPVGTLYAPFSSSISNPKDEKNSRRFMVMVPGNPKKYIAFIMGSSLEMDKGSLPRNISVVSVFKTPQKTRTYFADYQALGENKSRLTNIGNKDCNSCHLGAPLSLPKMGQPTFELNPSLNRLFKDNFQLINESIGEDALAVGDNYKNAGPNFGLEPYSVDIGLIRQCNKSIQAQRSKDKLQKIPDRQLMTSLAQNMNCTDCHSKESHSSSRPLHWYTFAKNWEYVKNHILSGSMPRNRKLPKVAVQLGETDRQNLLRCIEIWAFGDDKYPGAFERWAKDKLICDDDAT